MARLIATKNNARNKIGSQIAELPPALIILFLMIFFPLINMLYIFIAYGAGWYLNQLELRQVGFQAPIIGLSETQQIVGGAPIITYSNSAAFVPDPPLPQSQNWNGLMGVTEMADSPEVIYMPLVVNNAAVNQVGKVQVTTKVSIKPFLSQNFQWLPQVPGLNAPLKFTYASIVFQEEQTAAPPVLINNG